MTSCDVLERRSSFTLTARRVGEVLFVAASGLFGIEAHRKACHFLAAELAIRPAKAVVLDMRSVLHVMSDIDLMAIRGGDDNDDLPFSKVPTAVVSSRAGYELTAARCAALRRRGFLRVPMLDLNHAMEWAARRRPLRAPADC